MQGGRYLPCRLDGTQLQFESADSEVSKFADLHSKIDPRDFENYCRRFRPEPDIWH